jgi:L-alanine-DL-glutamate epimerase-like enolase superfamily enzyme
MTRAASPRIERLDTSVYRMPTDRPEADGTMNWDSTTLVLVEAMADSGQWGLGFSYCSATAAGVVREHLAPVIGRQGIAATAISAVDIALWDLKSRLANLPLFRLLGAGRDAVPIYGSGGFT